MFDVVVLMFTQLFEIMPFLIILYICFDFIGTWFFARQFMSFLMFIIFVVLWLVIDYITTIYCIKSNIDLFYALHKSEVERVLKKEGKINDIRT